MTWTSSCPASSPFPSSLSPWSLSLILFFFYLLFRLIRVFSAGCSVVPTCTFFFFALHRSYFFFSVLWLDHLILFLLSCIELHSFKWIHSLERIGVIVYLYSYALICAVCEVVFGRNGGNNSGWLGHHPLWSAFYIFWPLSDKHMWLKK